MVEDFFTQITSYFYGPVHEPSMIEYISNGIVGVLTAKRSSLYEESSGQNLEQISLLKLPVYLMGYFTDSVREMSFSDVLTVTFFSFGVYVAMQFFKKDGLYMNDFRLEAIPSHHIQDHIQNVSTLIDKMHETHAQISERMCELQVPLTMVKYRTKMVDEKLNRQSSNEQACGDSRLPSIEDEHHSD